MSQANFNDDPDALDGAEPSELSRQQVEELVENDPALVPTTASELLVEPAVLECSFAATA